MFAERYFRFDENGEKFSNRNEKEKFLVMSNFSFPHYVLKRLLLQTHKNKALFGKEQRVHLFLDSVENVVEKMLVTTISPFSTMLSKERFFNAVKSPLVKI